MSSEPIVVGTDGSQSAELAVEKAGELARSLGAKVHVVNSYKPVTTTAGWASALGGVPVSGFEDSEQERMWHEREKDRDHAEQIVARAHDRLRGWGVDASAHVCTGDAADALIAVAETEQAQMIVVGNRGMTGARRMLGSVPNSVSHNAPAGADRTYQLTGEGRERHRAQEP